MLESLKPLGFIELQEPEIKRTPEQKYLIGVYNDTLETLMNDPDLSAAMIDSQDKQYTILDDEVIKLNAVPRDKHAKVTVSKCRTIEAAEKYKDGKVCVLCFGSAYKRGGDADEGSSGQEEDISRVSTVGEHQLIDSKNFYYLHSIKLKYREGYYYPLFNDDLFYIPDVLCFKTPTDTPTLRPREEWFKFDIITCIPPFMKYRPIPDDQLSQLLYKRLERVFITAINNGADNLILGAFGCGRCKIPPFIVARVMMKLTEKYIYYFENIEFAVYCKPNERINYTAFSRVFKIESSGGYEINII